MLEVAAAAEAVVPTKPGTPAATLYKWKCQGLETASSHRQLEDSRTLRLGCMPFWECSVWRYWFSSSTVSALHSGEEKNQKTLG